MPADKSLKDLSGAVVKIAESYPKIQKDVKDIRDAICGTEGILEAINAISERLDKNHKQEQLKRLAGRQRTSELNNRKLLNNTSSINKTLNKIFGQMKTMSGKGGLTSAKMMRLGAENFRRQGGDTKIKHLEGISRSVDIIERLRGLKVKDFIFAKKKLKNIGKIMHKSLTMFRMFKDQEEVDGTLSFVESSISIVKKLGKLSILSKPAQWGEKAIENIYLGKKGEGGLLKLFRKIRKHKRDIDNGNKSLGKIAKACGSMLLTTMALAGIAVVGIPAMVGALLMKGVIWLLIGTFKMLRKANKSVIKGSAVLLIMSASIITFGLGLGMMAKAVKDMKLKDVGLMVASLAGMGLAIAGIGLLAVPIAIGSATLLLMGASLGVFGLALHAWKNIDVKASMGNIKLAVEGLRDTFGLELGKGDGEKNAFQRLGGGVLDIAMGVLNFGKSFFIMGSILLAGAALGMLYHGLKNWDNFNGTKAAGNIRDAIGALKEAFGIGESKDEGLGGKLGKLLGSPLDIGISLLQGGKALAEMGTIAIATGLSDAIRLFLIPWNKFDARPAANNLKIAISALKDAFGLEDKNTTTSKLGKFVGSILDMGTSLMNAGGVLGKMGTISIATGIADIIKLKLKPWENYNATAAISNMSLVVSSLTSLFGLDEKGGSPIGSLGNLAGNFFDLGTTFLKAGGVMAKMGTISIATGMLDKIKDNLTTWNNFNASGPIANIKVAVDDLLDVFGLGKMRKEEVEVAEGTGFWGKISGSLKKVGNVISDAFNTASSLVETASDVAAGGKVMAKMSNILHATSAMFSIRGALTPWDNYNSSQALSNIGNAIGGVKTLFNEITGIRNLDSGFGLSNSQYFESSASNIRKGIVLLADSWSKSAILKSAEIPFKKSVEAVNSLDISKASTMIDMFKSFSNINKKPFDKFTNAVNKFAESSEELIDALNNFNSNNVQSDESNVSTGSSTIRQVEGVNINNPQVLASAIAEALGALPINIENTMSDIRLVVNGDTGRRVILTLED